MAKVYANERRKPELQIVRLLVGHSYLANERTEGATSVHDLAQRVARRIHKEQTGNFIPSSADWSSFYHKQGYVVTFAWIEWVLIDEPVEAQGGAE